jgi:hypothetical protein
MERLRRLKARSYPQSGTRACWLCLSVLQWGEMWHLQYLNLIVFSLYGIAGWRNNWVPALGSLRTTLPVLRTLTFRDHARLRYLD